MTVKHLGDIDEREIIHGYHVKFVHSKNVTVAYWNVRALSAMPEHAHPHEQVVNLIEGKFELTVDGQTHTLVPGSVVIISPDVKHSGKALTDCRIIDVFHPVREDYL